MDISVCPPDLEEVVPDGSGYLHGFNAFGYSTGRQMVDPTCSILAGGTGLGSDAWLHDCALQSGDSGGPIIENGTLTLVALSSGMRRGFGSSNCATREPSLGGVLPRWDGRCTNVAVPLSWNIIEAVCAAEVANNVQMALARLGYDTDPLGTIGGSLTSAAIGRFQRETGMPVTGEPSCLLRTALRMSTPVENWPTWPIEN